jgi:hypothetical protein
VAGRGGAVLGGRRSQRVRRSRAGCGRRHELGTEGTRASPPSNWGVPGCRAPHPPTCPASPGSRTGQQLRRLPVLGQARPQGTLDSIDAALRGGGFESVGPDLDGYAHRYERDGLIVDVLAPDAAGPRGWPEGDWRAGWLPGHHEVRDRHHDRRGTLVRASPADAARRGAHQGAAPGGPQRPSGPARGSPAAAGTHRGPCTTRLCSSAENASYAVRHASRSKADILAAAWMTNRVGEYNHEGDMISASEWPPSRP